MLQENQVVRVRKALENLYTGTCTVTVREKYQKDNGASAFREVQTVKDQPCRLSYSTITSTTEGEAAASVTQVIRLHIAPEVSIPDGSRITVTQEGVTRDYACSGTPAVYDTHQEIVLTEWQRWA